MADRLDRAHDAMLYACIAVAFACVAAGQTLGVATLAGFVGAVLFSWFADRSTLADDAWSSWWNGLVLAVLAASVLQIALQGAGYINVGIRFVLILTCIKLLTRSGARDEAQLYALSFLIVAAATAVNEHVTFGLF
ncbi:MAG: hypothetical protein ABEL76_11260, partial [Bradymonadaceae bacterium]